MVLHLFLCGLLVVSVFTSLLTEAVKKWLTERNRPYKSNTLAGYCAVVLSVLVWIGYMVLTETAFSGQMVVYLIALILLSWLAAMVGYDKVVQAIAQVGAYKKDSNK